MGKFRGISIGIESKNRATAFGASDRILKVSSGSYLGHPYCSKVILTRLSYEQYLCIAIYQYVLIKKRYVCSEIDGCLMVNSVALQ